MRNLFLIFSLLICSLRASAQVAPITGPSSVCDGSTITLSDATPGGAWSGGTGTGPGLAIVGSANGAVTGLSQGIVTITYTVGAAFATTTVTINPMPGPITGPSQICISSTATLGNSVPGGTWYSTNPGVAAIAPTGMIVPIAMGVTTISYSLGTCRVTKTLTVSPNPSPIIGSSSVCTGSSITLSNTTTGGTWHSGNTSIATIGSSTGILTGVALGSVLITYTSTIGCEMVKSINTVTALPTISGLNNVCTGRTIQLANTVAGGIWSSSNPSIASVIPSNGRVTGVSSGGVTITYSAGTCTIVTKTVNSNPTPAIITGANTVCLGTTTTLSNATPGGTWTTSSGSIATVNSGGIVTGIFTGTAVISYTTVGCSETTTITVHPLPGTITGAPNLCIGSTELFTNSSAGTWSSSNTAVATIGATTGVINSLSLGGTTITFADGNSCTRTKTVTVSNTPVPTITGNTTLCSGSTTTYSNTTGGGTWSSSNTSVATIGATDGILSGIAPGIVTITYTNGTCGSTTKNISVGTAAVLYNVTGGGGYCSGAAGSRIGLSGSQTGVSYQLFLAGSAVGIPFSGSGSAIDFGPFLTTGNYTVAANNGSCTFNMNGSATVIMHPSPAAFTVTGGGGYCAGEPGVTIGTSGSSIGYTYELLLGGSPTGSLIYGMGAGLDFGTFTAVGTYSVIATSGPGCTTNCGGVTITGVLPTCTGIPTAGTTVANSTNLCHGITLNLSLSGYVPVCGTLLQWEQSADSSVWSAIPGATNKTYNLPASATLYYRCKATCTGSGLIDNSVPVHVTVQTTITSHSTIYSTDTACTSPDFYISTCGRSSMLNITTYFGDGASSSTPLASGLNYAHIFHSYSVPGTYSVKQVLYAGTIPQDSVTFSYEYMYCNTLPVKFYSDVNNNCIQDPGESISAMPIKTIIDSNGVPVDTISVTSGFYYKTYGAPVGTIYSFRILPTPGGMLATCPLTGVIYDTIVATSYSYPVKLFGLGCAPTTQYDFAVHATSRPQIGRSNGTIVVNNLSCRADTARVTMTFSPNYYFSYSNPAPVSIVGNTVTWLLTPAFSFATTRTIDYELRSSTFLLRPGDTVHTSISVTPTAADLDTSNNVIFKNDTVRASYDPNEVLASPAGYILPCTQLQYTVKFENTGNDTAHNIYILDTLSADVDMNSLEIVTASAVMNLAILKDGGYNVVKFDFPNIKLLDSSYHGQCHGMVVYNIKAKAGLTDGTYITNKAGIYFDENPPIQTNTAVNTIGVAPIAGNDSVCTVMNDTMMNPMAGGVWSCSNANATVAGGVVTGVTAGMDTVSYTVSNICGSRTTTKVVTIKPQPNAGSLSGSNAVCEGMTITLSNDATGGAWSSTDAAIAGIDMTGTVNGLHAGATTIAYAVSNSCGTAVVNKTVTVNPLPVAYTVTGGGGYCAGDTGVHISLSGSAIGINYQLYNGSTMAGSAVAGPGGVLDFGTLTAAGIYTVSATDPATGCRNNMLSAASVTVNALPVIYNVTGGGSYCYGAAGVHIMLDGSETGTVYRLYDGGTIAGSPITGTGTSLDFGPMTGAGTYTVSATNTAGCNNDMAANATVLINPLPAVYSVTGGGNYCSGDTGVHVLLASSATGISYQLYNSGVATGSPVVGTGSAIDFGLLTAAGSYTISGSDAITSCIAIMTDSAVITITPTVTPSVHVMTATDTVCGGTMTSFAATVTNAGTSPIYEWSVNGTVVSTVSTYSFIPVDSDVVAVMMTSNAQCASPATAATTKQMTVLQSLIPSVTITSDKGMSIKTGTDVTFTANVANGGVMPTYTWTVNENIIAGATGSMYTTDSLADGDSLSCMVISNGECGGYQSFNSVLVTVKPVNVADVSNEPMFTLFPNPNKGTMTIQGATGTGTNEPIAMTITNVLGQVVYKGIVKALNGKLDEQIILGADIANGVYMLKMHNVLQNSTACFVIEK